MAMRLMTHREGLDQALDSLLNDRLIWPFGVNQGEGSSRCHVRAMSVRVEERTG
jgi:hypothetical protein